MIFRSVNMMKTYHHLLRPHVSRRHFNVGPSGFRAAYEGPRRSYLYVPSSSQAMLEKSLELPSDVIIYDLEDSVPPSETAKVEARKRLVDFLDLHKSNLRKPQCIAVRVNGITTPFFRDDIAQVLASPAVGNIVLPKVNDPRDIHHASREIYISAARKRTDANTLPISIIASIESARGVCNLAGIARWRSEHGRVAGGCLTALLFAAEDYCANTSVVRTPSRRELLYARSAVVTTAKGFGLDAIDMVCVNYKDSDHLKEECIDGKQLGFTGKQAIHPSQTNVIESTFMPSSEDIAHAVQIIRAMDEAHVKNIGAVGLEGQMIDLPVLRQAKATIRSARNAGMQLAPTLMIGEI